MSRGLRAAAALPAGAAAGSMSVAPCFRTILG